MKHLKTVLILALLFILSVPIADAGQRELRIIYLNDFHGFAEPYRPFGSDEMLGGIAYLAGRVRQLRSEKTSILLAAGDMIQGNNWANFSQGQSVIELMNEMNFDAMVVGNHEFDFGQDVLKKRIEEAKFPVLGANVSGLAMLRPYVIIGGGRDKCCCPRHRYRRCSCVYPSEECCRACIFLRQQILSEDISESYEKGRTSS